MNTPIPPSTLAAFYGRVSTAKQDASIQTQVERGLEYAATRGLSIPPDLRFEDSDTSGSTSIFKRKGGRSLCNTMAAWPDCRHVIVTHPDRIGRDTLDGLTFLAWCKKRGILIHLIDFGGDAMRLESATGEMQITMIFAMSKWFLNNLRSSIKHALDHRRSQGLLVGTVPYGKDKVPINDRYDAKAEKVRTFYKLVDNPAEQHWIRQMAAWRAGGMSLPKIAAELNRRAVPTKIPAGLTVKLSLKLGTTTLSTGRWNAGSVRGVLGSSYTLELLAQDRTQVQSAAA